MRPATLAGPSRRKGGGNVCGLFGNAPVADLGPWRAAPNTYASATRARGIRADGVTRWGV